MSNKIHLTKIRGALLGVLVACQTIAQVPSSFFTTLGAEGDDVGFAVKETAQGYIIAGASTSYGTNGSVDGYLVKANAVGFPSWQKFIGGQGVDAFYAFTFAPDSGIIAVGYTNSFGMGGYDIYIVRTDKSGDTLWTRTWGGTQWEFANDVVLTHDSSIMVVGFTESFGTGGTDAVLLKFNFDGTFDQQKFFGGPGYDDFRSIIVTQDSMLAIVGLTESGSDENGDAWFLKTSIAGDTIFTKHIGGPYADRANDIVQKAGKEFVIAGARTFTQNTPSHAYMYCFSDDGTFIWENNYYHSLDDEEYVSVANFPNLPGHTGFLKNIPVPNLAFQGNLLVASPGGWPYVINSFGGDQDEKFYSIEGTSDGGFVIVGKTKSFDSRGDDIFFLKFDTTIANYKNTVGIQTRTDGFMPAHYYLADSRLLLVKNVSDEIEVGIISQSGELLGAYPLTRNDNELDLSGYSPGLFFLRFKTNYGSTYHGKLLITE